MLSAASCPFPLHSAAASYWSETQIVFRRVCLLRSAGKNAEADELEAGALSKSLAALRAGSTVTQPQLDALFEAEGERVADARLLAEILLPMLTESLGAAASLPGTSQTAASSSSRNAPAGTLPSTTPAQDEAPAPRDTTPGLPGIADFIDDMISKERAPRGSRRSA